MRRPVDVVALVFGVVLTAGAGLALWVGLGGPVDPQVVSVGAPLLLVCVGVLGLAASRNRP